MKENISTQPVSNEAGANGLNALDKQKKQHILHLASKTYPLMPTWRVYRIYYWPTSKSSYVGEKKGAVK